MSNLFMDMHRRRQNRITDFSSNSSFNASAFDLTNNVAEDDANEAEDEISNILSLKLKKPKHWKWELTTSRSCTNIALPRILLYDHNGKLLVDANSQEEQIYKPTAANAKRKHLKNRAATANLVHSISEAFDEEFDGLQIQEATPSLQSPTTSTQQTRNSSPLASSSCIDFYTNDLPDYKFERRSSSLKGVRFKDDNYDNYDNKSSKNSFQINGLPTPPPSSGTTPTTTTGTGTGSSSSGPREKRRYRRSHSSGRSPVNSPSILERFSYSKGRFSSPEYAEETNVYHSPRYYLATSKAGTLVVKEESFSRYRRRRPRPKNSSNEYLPNVTSPLSCSTNSLKATKFLTVQNCPSAQSGSLQNVADLRRKKKALPIRRFRSDGNVLLQADSSSSEIEAQQLDKLQSEHAAQRPRHRYEQLKRHLKGDIVTIHPENGVFHPYGSPTER